LRQCPGKRRARLEDWGTIVVLDAVRFQARSRVPHTTFSAGVVRSAKQREDSLARVEIIPHVELRRADRTAIRVEAKRTARVCEPEVTRVEVVGV